MYRFRLNWRGVIISIISVTMLFVSSCRKQKSVEEQSQAGPKTFASPDDAGKALVEAANTENREALLAIFGPSSQAVIYSGDASQDKAALQGFVSDYNAMHRWRKLPDGSELLIAGTDNKVFPIPLKKNTAGQWTFDTQAGQQELLARRIGRDENAAIDICQAIADAQHEYYSQAHDGAKQYAQRFISAEGKQDGLYWPGSGNAPRSPLGPLVAYASSEGYNVQPSQHHPYFGYYFVMLDRQGAEAKGGAKDYIVNGKMTGGFAALAYPSNYGDSGIMTFMISQNGSIYQKDLGKSTDQLAAQITAFNPDKTWKPVSD